MTKNELRKYLIIARLLLPLTERACDRICDSLIDLCDSFDDFKYDELMMRLARIYDRTESFHAAHIRDTFADNL